MVTQTIIQEYGFDTIDDYFDYIIESRVNGNYKQERELFNALSIRQKGRLFSYCYEYDIQQLKEYFSWL
jgi:hypothetical protein